jgi:hypothetical protein
MIGCAINFIRRCCDDAEWQMDSNTIALASGNLTYDNLSKLDTIISNAAAVANKRVMELLFKKYKLDMHLTGTSYFFWYLSFSSETIHATGPRRFYSTFVGTHRH